MDKWELIPEIFSAHYSNRCNKRTNEQVHMQHLLVTRRKMAEHSMVMPMNWRDIDHFLYIKSIKFN